MPGPMTVPSVTPSIRRSPFRIAWLGETGPLELSLARSWADDVAQVADGEPDDGPEPTVIVLASDRPGRWMLADAVAVSQRWPLARLVSVATSLSDGRRRSGPALPGIEEVPWNEFAGRLSWWLNDLAHGRPGGLGMPATSRPDERMLDAAAGMRRAAADAIPRLSVAVAAARREDLEAAADLVAATGHAIARRSPGRPAVDEPADVLVWDVVSAGPQDLAWLRMLSANRPALRVILLDSFPRGDGVAAALQAGAAAVLGRPASLESLAGTLLRLSGQRPF